jgi:hypothetical protein
MLPVVKPVDGMLLVFEGNQSHTAASFRVDSLSQRLGNETVRNFIREPGKGQNPLVRAGKVPDRPKAGIRQREFPAFSPGVSKRL